MFCLPSALPRGSPVVCSEPATLYRLLVTFTLARILSSISCSQGKPVECGSVTLLSLVLSIRVMLEILVETTA
jgi:hypothetical protein